MSSGFDSWWSLWDFSVTYSFQPHYDPGVDAASNRNKFQVCSLGGKDGRCVGLTSLPFSFADCVENLGALTPGYQRACPGVHRNTLEVQLLSFHSWIRDGECSVERSGHSALKQEFAEPAEWEGTRPDQEVLQRRNVFRFFRKTHTNFSSS
jgi:hypothetical protein